MQPTLVLGAPQPGILYINGRFAGEISNEDPLMRPVSSRGAVYLDYRPLSSGCEAMARKLVFSGGFPLAQSVESAADLDIVIWPGAVIEIEFSPPRRKGSSRHFTLGGRPFSLEDDRLYCGERFLSALPEGALQPEIRSLPMGNVLSGGCDGGRYLLMTDADFTRQLGFMQAQQMEISDDGRIQAIVSPGDLVGHATLENWRLTLEGLMLVSSEPAWANGAPRWPATPAETARAAMEAALAGLQDEAEGYLSPALRGRGILQEMCRDFDLCVEMKYAPPDSRPSIGLLRLEGERMARVQPLYYRAAPSGGVQGPWQIDELELR